MNSIRAESAVDGTTLLSLRSAGWHSQGRVYGVYFVTACTYRPPFYLSSSFAVRQEEVCGISEIGIRTPSAKTPVTHSWLSLLSWPRVASPSQCEVNDISSLSLD